MSLEYDGLDRVSRQVVLMYFPDPSGVLCKETRVKLPGVRPALLVRDASANKSGLDAGEPSWR